MVTAMTLANLIGRLRALRRKRGLLGLARRVAEVAYRRLTRWRIPRHPFDRQHGVETGGLLYAKKIPSGHAHDAQSTAYFGSQPSVVHMALQQWIAELRETGQHPRDFTFVDIGCGKGRVLMLASEFPFQRVIGLELSPEMVERARENLKRWAAAPHRCKDISVVQGDVLEFPLPEGPALLFMYHPFEEELFGRWVQSLQPVLPARSAPLYLLYANPYYESQLQALPEARLLWSGEVAFTKEEAAAHLFGGTAERVSLYRLTPAGP